MILERICIVTQRCRYQILVLIVTEGLLSAYKLDQILNFSAFFKCLAMALQTNISIFSHTFDLEPLRARLPFVPKPYKLNMSDFV